MESKVYNWNNNIHLVIVILSIIPLFFDTQNQLWLVLIIIGLLIILQCFHYVSIDDANAMKDKDIYIHCLCILGKIFLVTLYLATTGYWFYSPLYYVVFYLHNKREVTAALIFPVVGTFTVWIIKYKSFDELPLFLLAIFIVSIITILLYAIETFVKQLIDREHKLSEQMNITSLNELKVKNLNRELAIKYQLADLNARLEERENIARNIHNVVGHTITSSIVSLQAYRVLQTSEPQRAEDKLTAATERMRLALEEIRRAVRVLDQETNEISLKDFQQLLLAELNRFSIDTELNVSHNLKHMEADQVIDKRCCEFLHSALTECLNNGIRHGNATSFFVFMQCDTNCIKLTVTDNGTGFEQLSKVVQDKHIQQGYGLRKMEQFVNEHGGTMKISSDSGFSVHLELPLLHV